MQIRSYQPGDELAQARIYNVAAGSLPGFKPAKPEEITRRLHAGDADPQTMFYATENSEVVGYAVFGPNGRVSFPWCFAGRRNGARTVARNGRRRDEPARAHRGLGHLSRRLVARARFPASDTTSPRFDP